MTWAEAIETNQAALVRILATLVALVEAHAGSMWLPEAVHRTVARQLKPVESAVRRLILIAAEKFVRPSEKVSTAPRKWPAGLVIPRRKGGSRRAPFHLYDPLRTFIEWGSGKPKSKKRAEPRVHVIGYDPRVPAFLRSPPPAPEPADKAPAAPKGFISARMILRRIESVQAALANIPREALRLHRAMARNQAKEPEQRRNVLRPGPPPGGRKRPREEIDEVLTRCHAMARHALSPDSS